MSKVFDTFVGHLRRDTFVARRGYRSWRAWWASPSLGRCCAGARGIGTAHRGMRLHECARRTAAGAPWEPFDTNRHVVRPDFSIVEIKVNERAPYWLTDWVARHNLQLIRMSKYCQSVEVYGRAPRSVFHLPEHEDGEHTQQC